MRKGLRTFPTVGRTYPIPAGEGRTSRMNEFPNRHCFLKPRLQRLLYIFTNTSKYEPQGGGPQGRHRGDAREATGGTQGRSKEAQALHDNLVNPGKAPPS